MDNITKLYYNKAVSLQEKYDRLFATYKNLMEGSSSRAFGEAGEDIYKILEVGEDATQEQIKKAYRAKLLKYHPDLFNNLPEAERLAADKEFKRVQTAYDIASNPSSTDAMDYREGRKKHSTTEQPKTSAQEKPKQALTGPKPGSAAGKPQTTDKVKPSIPKPSVGQRAAHYAKGVGKILPSFAGYMVGDVGGQYLSNFAGIENELGREAISTTTGGVGLAAGESAIPAVQAARQSGLRAGSSSLLRGTAAATAPAIGMLGGYAVGSKAAENILDYAGVENETGRFVGTQAGGLIGGIPGAALAAGTVGGGKALLAGAGLKGAALAGKAAAVAGAGAALPTVAAGAAAIGGYMLGDYIGDKTGLHKYIGDKLGGADKLTEKPTGTVGGVEAINLKNKDEEAEEKQRQQEMDRQYIAKPKEELVKEILAKRKAAREAQTQN